MFQMNACVQDVLAIVLRSGLERAYKMVVC